MKTIKKTGFIILLSLIVFAKGYIVSADSNDEKIEISTLSMSLDDDEQIYEEGTEEKLSKVNKSTMKFIKNIAYDAIESGRDYGLYPSITIAQAVLETGSGKSALSLPPYNNVFGIKGFYNGNSVRMKTGEHDNSGNKYYIYANFRKYPSVEESLRDHDGLLRYGLNGYYSCSWRENSSSPQETAYCLQGKYATDKNYASKLINIIENYNLERFDGLLTPRDIKWLSSESLDPWELPMVDNETMNKIQTWASSPNDSIAFTQKAVEAMDDIESGVWEEYSADKYYIEEILGIKVDFNDKSLRKKEPSAGDIAAYKVETSDGQIVENYAIVEGFRKNAILISEGIMSESGFNEVYRIVLSNSLDKYEFIDIQELVN